MKPALIAFMAMLLSSCANHQPAGVEAKADEAPKKSGEITLSAESQRNGGIVTQPAVMENVSETISANGQLTVNEDRTYSVGALLAGRVTSVSAKVGDRVTTGQVLARIHSHDVHDARAGFRKAESELARALSAESLARGIRDRALRLFDLKAASKAELESAEADLRNAGTGTQNAKIELERERTHIVEFLEVPIEDDHNDKNADFAPIKSPGSGLVTERKAGPGSVVAAGDQMFRITSTSDLWMIANVNEADLGQLRTGQAVRIRVRAFPERSFSGRILQLGEQLDPTTRTLQVRIAVPNPGNILKPEMFATAEIERGRSRQSFFVPEDAVQELNGASVVFVRTATDKFEPRAIGTARALDGRVEVTAGLRPNDQLVTKGAFIVKSQLLKSSLAEE